MDKNKKRLYDRERYLRIRGPEKIKEYKSRYRWKNNGNGSGIPTHQILVRKVMGRSLPNGAEIHHVDGNGHNNDPSNLVVCPSHGYHMLLHKRDRALRESGNANWLKCQYCQIWDDPSNMYLYTPKDQVSPRGTHRMCVNNYRKRKEVHT